MDVPNFELHLKMNETSKENPLTQYAWLNQQFNDKIISLS